MPKFSVIVPVYNAEKYIEQCVCSLMNQQCKEYEIILVNDCSTDRSLELCNFFAKQNSNIVVVDQPQNKGVSAARNKGIEIAKGDYILFVDADDFVAADYFETLKNLTIKGGYDLISFGNYDYLIDGDENVETKISNMNYDVSCNDTSPWNKLFLKTFFASPWNKLFLKKILLSYNIRFDESCVCYEDYLFNVEYCKHISTFKAIAKPLYYYRQFTNINHVSKRKWGEFLLISEKVARCTDEFIVLKEEKENLSNLRRYTYQSFVVELQSVKNRCDDKAYTSAVRQVVRNYSFQNSVRSISPRGIKLSVIDLLCRLHFYLLVTILIKK